MGENLKEQKQIIDNVEAQVDDLTAELSKTAKKLKATLAKWKSAPGAATSIVMILILLVLVGVLVYVVKDTWL